MTAFTFDLPDVATAIVGANKRGADVTLVVDERSLLSGQTMRMRTQLDAVAVAGIKVFTQRGGDLAGEYAKVGRNVKIIGHLHAKCAIFLDGGKGRSGSSTNRSQSSYQSEIDMPGFETMSMMSASSAAENETSTLLNGQRGGSPLPSTRGAESPFSSAVHATGRPPAREIRS